MAPGIPGFAKEVVWTVDWHGDIGTCSSCWRNFYSRMAFLRQPTLWDGVFLTRHHLIIIINYSYIDVIQILLYTKKSEWVIENMC